MKIKRLFLGSLFILMFSSVYAENLDRHRFGISIEGGYSFWKSSDTNGIYFPEKLKGNFGGTLFYQFNINKCFAIRPEIGLYSYFFGLSHSSVDYYSTYGVTYATFNGRIGAGLFVYYYTNKNRNFTLNFGLTPLISMRFYDSANLYLNRKSNDIFGDTDIKSDRLYYVSGGLIMSLGIETEKAEKPGFGGSLFLRFADKPTNKSDNIIIIPSFGAFFVIYF
jgi:hypothetical protein